MVRIAVTGGIACGKSSVGAMLRARGIPVIEADALVHHMMAPGGAVYGGVVEAFRGRDIVDAAGAIDRRALGEIVFRNEPDRRKLKGIIHPVVQREMAAWLRGRENEGARMAAAVVPLLYEADMAEGWDTVLCVACTRQIQFRRLRERGFSEEDAARRVAAQMPLRMKMRLADMVLFNSGTLAVLEQQVDMALERIGRPSRYAA